MPDSDTNSNSASSPLSDYFTTDHSRSDLRTRALRSATVTIIAQGCTFVAGTAGTIILARLLTPRDFGLVTMVLSISLLLQNFGTNGFIEATIQRPEIHHRLISTFFWANVALSFVLTLLFMASAPVIAWFYKEPLLKPIVVVMAVPILLSGLSTQHQALLMRKLNFYRTSVYEVGAAIISLAVAVLLALRGWGYWALVAKWVVSPLVITAGAWIMCGWRPGAPSRRTGVRPMLRFAFNTYGNFVLNYLGKTVDKILVGRFQGSQPLGNYDRAYQLSNMLPNQLVNPLANVAIASFSRLSNDPEKYRRNYLQVLSILSFVCMPISAALTLMGKDLILLLLGPQWTAAGELFTVFGFSIGVMMLYMTHAWLHLSLGTPGRWFRWSIIALTITVVFIAVGLRFGAFGVAVGYSASFYVLLAPALWYAGRPVHLRLSFIVSAIWKYYVSALATGLLCWYVLHKAVLTSNVFNQLGILYRIVLTLFACVLIYLPLVVLFYGSLKPVSQFIFVLREMIPNTFSAKRTR